MIQCKKLLAASHGTETSTFAGGAYVTDPLAYVSVLCAQSPFMAVGGDAGGGFTKIGITYSHNGKQSFACLLVYFGGDSWLELQDCRAEGLTPFKGDSAAFPHIWAVLQRLITDKQVRQQKRMHQKDAASMRAYLYTLARNVQDVLIQPCPALPSICC